MADQVPASPPSSAPDAARTRKARRTLLLLAAICIAPVVASYTAYYLLPRDAKANYGTLLTTAPAPAIEGIALDGTAFRLADAKGRWLLLIVADDGCDVRCEKLLYATRQARTMQGREQDRITRVLLIGAGAAPSAALVAEHPGLVVARVEAASRAALPGARPSALLIDPLGNLVLRYGEDPDIKGIGKDLTRLLKASRIG
jgi:hypothetical protein